MQGIIERLKKYFEKRDMYAFVLLFGSTARGAQHSMSDVDIGVYFEDKENILEIGYDVAQLEGLIGKKIDIVVLNDLYKKDPLLAYEIYEDHRPIIVTNEEKYVAFKRNALVYYLDHLPLIEQNRKVLKKRIEEGKVGERNYA